MRGGLGADGARSRSVPQDSLSEGAQDADSGCSQGSWRMSA